MNRGYINNQAVSILNTLDLQDNAQPVGGDNLPIGMRENPADIGSNNFGTDRDSVLGGAIIGSSTSYITTNYIQKGYANADGFTISFWINKTPDMYGKDSRFIGDQTTGIKRVRLHTSTSTTLTVEVNFDTTTILNVSHDRVLQMDDGWNLLTYTWSFITGDYCFFVNGIVQHESNDTSELLDGAEGINIIKSNNANNVGFFDYRIYSRGLSSDEIWALYNNEGVSRSDLDLHYKTQSGSTTHLIDSSGNNNNGTIVNWYSGFNGFQNEISPADEEGFTLSDGLSYYYNSAATELIPAGVIIPKDDSVPLPPFKAAAYVSVGVKADLEFIGKVPARAEIVQGNALKGDGSAFADLLSTVPLTAPFTLKWYMEFDRFGSYDAIIGGNTNYSGVRLSNIDNKLQFRTDNADYNGQLSDTDLIIGDKYICNLIVAADGSFEFYLNDVLDKTSGAGSISSVTTIKSLLEVRSAPSTFANRKSNCTLWGISVDGAPLLPLSEYIEDPDNHTAHDVSDTAGVPNGNHATLINGSTANRGTQDEFFYGELGITQFGRYASNTASIKNNLTVDYGSYSVIRVECEIIPLLGTGFDYFIDLGQIILGDKQIATQFGTTRSYTPVFVAGSKYKIIFEIDINGNQIVTINDVIVSTIDISGDIKTITSEEFIALAALNGSSNNWDGDLHYCRVYGDGNIIFDLNTATGVNRYENGTINISGDVTSVKVPALASDITKDALGNPITVQQDGNSFLGTCKMKHSNMARIKDAFWRDGVTEEMNTKELADFDGNYNDQVLSDVSDPDRVKNARSYKQPLTGRQLQTEKVITNNI